MFNKSTKRKMKKNLFKAAVCCMAMLAMAASCSSDNDVESDDIIEGDYVVNTAYPEKVIKLNAEQRGMVEASNDFAFNFFRQVNADQGEKSCFCSPLSLSYMLGMLITGADGETRQQMLDVLGFNTDDPLQVNIYCANLLKNAPLIDPKVTLSIANSIYVNSAKGTITPDFDQQMKQYYDADVEALNFTSPDVLGRINGWASEKTNGMIPSILDEVDPSCVMYLLNAIFFKADWTTKFESKYTKKAEFIDEKGDKEKLPMMHQKMRMYYGEATDYTAISLPYGEGAFSMTILLPREGRSVGDVIDGLKGRALTENEMKVCDVDVKIPRFSTFTDLNLIELMKRLGMVRAFDSFLAEFPWMVNEGGLYVSLMKQKARIEVDEEGSKAAAVTIVGGNYVTSLPDKPVEYEKHDFHANRPFVYVISERGSNVVFFVGKFSGQQ